MATTLQPEVTQASLSITLLIAGAFFMENLDGTIIAVALPQMAKSFAASPVSLNIGMTAYLLTLAALIPVSGWMADRFGSRTVFASAIVIFTIASALCGLSQSLTEFTLMRIGQGVGGAMMVPVGRLIVLRNTPKEHLTQAIAYITWPGLTALVLGPPLGGFITTYASWHWIFFMNLPLGIAAFCLALAWIPNIRGEHRQTFDYVTFVLGGSASCGAVYGFEKLGAAVDRWHFPVTILLLSFALGAFAIGYARRHPQSSLIDIESLRFKTFSLSVYGATFFRIAVTVLPFLLPLLFQSVFGWPAFQSGLCLLVLFGGDLSMKAFVIPVLRAFGFRRILIVNGICTAITIALCATFHPGSSTFLLCCILFLHGACRSLQFTCMGTLAYVEISRERMSRANGFLSAIWQLSMGMGIAVGAVLLRLLAAWHGHRSAAPQLSDFKGAFLLVALLALGPVIDALSLAPNAGSTTSGHIPPPLRAKTA